MKLKLSNLSCEDLVDTGSWRDKQDPGLTFTLGKHSFKTKRQQDSGTAAVFPEIWELDISDNDLKDNDLQVECLNIGLLGSGTHIGVGSISIKHLLDGNEWNKTHKLNIELTHKGKKKVIRQGKVNFNAEIIGTPPTAVKEKPPKKEKNETRMNDENMENKGDRNIEKNIKQSEIKTEAETETETEQETEVEDVDEEMSKIVKIRIAKLEVRNMKNVEYTGKNDLYVECAFGSRWIARTSVIEEAGKDAEWNLQNDENFTFSVALGEVKDISLSLTVSDENNFRGDTLIGSIEFPIGSIKDAIPGTQVPFHLSVKDKKGKEVGRASCYCALLTADPTVEQQSNSKENDKDRKEASKDSKDSTKEEEEDEEPSEPFKEGTLSISKITCFDLKNVEMMGGKNDPYVTLRLSKWEDTTHVADSSGNSAIFDFLDFNTEVTDDMVVFEPLKVSVYDKNDYRNDVIIGNGETSLKTLLRSVDKEKGISVDIANEKGKKTGKVVIYCKISRKVYEEEAIDIPEDFTHGNIMLRRLVTSDLDNDSKGYSCAFTYGHFNEKISPLTENTKGRGPLFDNLGVILPAKASELQNLKLDVSISQDGILSTSVVCTSKVSLLKLVSNLEDEFEIPMKLTDTKGKSKGRAVLYATLMLPKPEKVLEVPADFVAGRLVVRKIVIKNIKNTEKFGKQDPYVILQYKDISKQTAVQNNVGSDAVWDDQFLSFDLESPEDVRANKLQCIVMESNVSSDIKLGDVECDVIQTLIPLADSTSPRVGEETKLHEIPLDLEPKGSGKIILYTEVLPPKKEDVPVVIPQDFENATIKFTKVSLNGMQQSSLISTNIFVIFRYRDISWSEQLDTNEVVNKKVLWDPLDFSFNINDATEASNALIDMEVWYDGMIDSVIGKAQFKVDDLCANIGEIVVKDFYLKDKNNAETGMSASLTMIAEKLAVEIIEDDDVHLQLPESFTNGRLYIHSLVAKDLVNPDFIGKSDPYALLTLEDVTNWEEATDRLENKGSDVAWNDLNMTADITKDMLLNNQKLKIEIYDANRFRNDVLIGTGTVSIQRPAYALGTVVEITTHVMDPKNKAAGTITASLELREVEANPKPKIPEDFENGYLKIARICTYDLKNTELIGQQDPYITFERASWKVQTQYLDNVGSDAVWENLELRMPITRSDMETNVPITVQAWDKNVSFDASIGTGIIKLTDLDFSVETTCELTINLKDSSRRNAGKVVIFTEIQKAEDYVFDDMVDDSSDPLEIAEDLLIDGALKIKRITMVDLKNQEMFGQQDVYVNMSHEEWKSATNVLYNCGPAPAWDHLDFDIPISREMLTSRKHAVAISVMNKNTLKDSNIGEVNISLRRVIKQLNNEIELRGNILDKNGKNVGSIVLLSTFIAVVKEEDIVIDEKFKKGILRINKIRTFALKNTEFLGSQDPYVVLKIQDWEGQTWVQDNAGSDCFWDNLQMEVPLDRFALENQVVDVFVYDKNNSRSDTLIGRGSASLKKCGATLNLENELNLLLMDEKGNSSGRVTVFAIMDDEIDEEIDDSQLEQFRGGKLHIKRVTVLVKSSGTSWFGKKNRFVTLNVGKQQFKTSSKKAAGINVTWDNLNFKEDIDKDILMKEGVLACLMDDNMITTDSPAGSSTLSIKKLAIKNKIGTDVDVSSNLLDESGETIGRITIESCLIESPKEKDYDAEITSKFGGGCLRIHSIAIRSEKKEVKTDIYMQLRVGDWRKRTSCNNAKEENCTWSDLSFKPKITGDKLPKLQLIVSAFDGSKKKGHTFLGTANLALKSLHKSIDSKKTLTAEIQRDGEIMAEVDVVVTLQQGEDIEEDTGFTQKDLIFEQGTVCVDSIECLLATHVKKFRIICKQADVEKKSQVYFESASSTFWPLIDLKSHLPRNELVNSEVQVSIIDETNHGVVGVGSALVSGLGLDDKSSTLDIELVDPNHKESWIGSVYVKGYVTKSTEFPTGIDDFPMGDEAVMPEIHSKVGDVQSEIQKQHSDMQIFQMHVNQELGKMKGDIKTKLQYSTFSLKKHFKKMHDGLDGKLSGQIDLLQKQLEKVAKRKKLSNLNSLKLPNDVREWRAAHVQAWLSYKLDLPEYLEVFKEMSIDGMVLLTHIDEKELASSLQIKIDFHRRKILGAIDDLKSKQKDIDQDAESKRMAAFKKKKALEDAKAAEAKAKKLREENAKLEQQKKLERQKKLAAEKEKEKEKAKKLKKKKGKKKKVGSDMPPQMATVDTNVREQNELLRIKLKKQMQERQKAKARANADNDKRKRTWAFEYDGSQLPSIATSLSLQDGGNLEKSLFNSSMVKVLESNKFMNADETLVAPPKQNAIKVIPKNCTSKEVLAVVKASMREVSEWLVAVERLETRKQAYDDQDLDRSGKTDIADEIDMNVLLSDEIAPPHSFQPYDNDDYIDDDETVFSESPPGYTSNNDVDGYDGDDHSEPPPMYKQPTPPTYNSLPPSSVSKQAFTSVKSSREDLLQITGITTGTTNTGNTTDIPTVADSSLSFEGLGDSIGRELEHNPYERVDSLFRAFVCLQNNSAHKWLPPNSKMTRMKFLGGIKSILCLKINWIQFESLWSMLDKENSGELDMDQFRNIFADIDNNGPATDLSKSKDKDTKSLKAALNELGDALRSSAMSIHDIFSAFDRNASGEITVAEFRSMVKEILGHSTAKGQIYTAFESMDTDGNKSISSEEVSSMIYRIWRMQLEDLDEKLVIFSQLQDNAKIRAAMNERNSIKEAIRRNFPRNLRDKLFEQGHNIGGPFSNILKNIGFDTDRNRSSNQYSSVVSITGSPKKSRSPERTNSPNRFDGEILRYKLKNPKNAMPYREGKDLKLPNVTKIGADAFQSFTIQASLDETEPYSQKLYALK